MLGTGEHGVGMGKREYLEDELGIGTVELMKTIKRAIDPLGLFNPGKVFGSSQLLSPDLTAYHHSCTPIQHRKKGQAINRFLRLALSGPVSLQQPLMSVVNDYDCAERK